MKLRVGAMVMGITKTVSIEEDPVRTEDNADYILTRWTGTFICWYNPTDTSYGGDTTVATFQPGLLPAQTDRAISEYLVQPRRHVIVEDEFGNRIIDEPRTTLNYTTDAHNGPFVDQVRVDEIHGIKTWQITLRITVFLHKNKAPSSPMVAHRWTQWADYDEDSYMTRTTEGIATFRTDELLRLGNYPDQYRRDLFFAIPYNFKRDDVHVEALGDGSGVRYRIVDVEKPLNFNKLRVIDKNVSRIEAYQTGGSVRESDAVVSLAAQGAFAAGFPNPVSMLGAIGSGIGRGLPKYQNTLIVNVWGNRLSARADLAVVALQMAYARLGEEIFDPKWRSRNVSLTYDLTHKFVRLEWRVSWGIEQMAASSGWLGTAVRGLLVTLGNPPAIPAPGVNDNPVLGSMWRMFNMSSKYDATGNASVGWIIGDGDTARMPPEAAHEVLFFMTQPPPPNSQQTRGSSLVSIIHQTLTAPWQTPKAPPGVASASDVDPTLTPSLADKRLY